jgi:hypothetical protein
MKMTLNAALKVADTGDWTRAWTIAQQDEGLLPGVTFNQWRVFAEQAITARKVEGRW